MTKNKRRAVPTGLTSQGVRDLNNLGPRKTRPSDATSREQEVFPHKYQLSSLYGKFTSDAQEQPFRGDDES